MSFGTNQYPLGTASGLGLVGHKLAGKHGCFGIYGPTGILYASSSFDLHISLSAMNDPAHANNPVVKCIRKHGGDTFTYEVCDSAAAADSLAKAILKRYSPPCNRIRA